MRSEIVKKLLDDQLDIYTMTFYPQEYYNQFDKSWLDDFSTKLKDIYNNMVIDKGFHPDDDCEIVMQEVLNVLDRDHNCI